MRSYSVSMKTKGGARRVRGLPSTDEVSVPREQPR